VTVSDPPTAGARFAEPAARPREGLVPPARGARRPTIDARLVSGLAVVLAVLAAAALAPVLSPWDPVQSELASRLKPPGWIEADGRAHPLGTDELGRDLLSRILHGAQISVLVGFLTVALTGVVGVVLGLVSGYFRGWADAVIMRVADVQLAFPFLLLAIAIMAVLRPSLSNVILVLVISGWVAFARLARAQALSVGARDYVMSARVIGCGDGRILGRYLLPNIAPALIVLATYQVPQMILAEASLSFLGLGIQPPTPTWGLIISTGRDYLAIAWWVSTLPGVALILTVVGIGLIGDWLRDRLDPTLRVSA
jgi:peptide/nickel transport system permease protein